MSPVGFMLTTKRRDSGVKRSDGDDDSKMMKMIMQGEAAVDQIDDGYVISSPSSQPHHLKLDKSQSDVTLLPDEMVDDETTMLENSFSNSESSMCHGWFVLYSRVARLLSAVKPVIS